MRCLNLLIALAVFPLGISAHASKAEKTKACLAGMGSAKETQASYASPADRLRHQSALLTYDLAVKGITPETYLVKLLAKQKSARLEADTLSANGNITRTKKFGKLVMHRDFVEPTSDKGFDLFFVILMDGPRNAEFNTVIWVYPWATFRYIKIGDKIGHVGAEPIEEMLASGATRVIKIDMGQPIYGKDKAPKGMTEHLYLGIDGADQITAIVAMDNFGTRRNSFLTAPSKTGVRIDDRLKL